MSEPVRPGTPFAKIVAEEERMYARVQARVALGDQDDGPRIGVSAIDEQLITIRDAIGEARAEDLPPLVEEMTRLSALRGKIGGSRTLPIDAASPYFAHMALRERGKSRDVLVGKRGFIDRDSGVQIVDWRNAPISQIYYRYEEGDDYDEEIGGRQLAGVVELRRNVSIARGTLRRIGAPQGTFVRDPSGAWHAAVGQAAPVLQGGQGTAARAAAAPKGTLGVHHGPTHRADKHLPEIAALIDAEQFDLITQPESGLLVIQGGAGSGKTTVALHRIAYLMYEGGRRFSPKRILFVVPSRALERYVADVLPSLGVEGVPVVTYEGWARKTRQKMVRGSSGKYNTDTPEAAARLKKHPAMLTVLERYAADHAAGVDRALEQAVAGLAGADAVLAQWRAAAERPLVSRLRGLWRWLRGGPEGLPQQTRTTAESTAARLGKRADDVVAHWAEVLTDRPRLRQAFATWGDVSDAEIERLVQWCVRQHDSFDEDATDMDGRLIATADGRALDEEDPRGRFDVEDDPILLRLVQLLRGGLVNREGNRVEYEHVAIDEAQDRSAIEVKVLLEATAMHGDDPSARSVTIAGDTAQRIVFDNNFDGWEHLLAQTGHAGAVVKQLELSYRSTAEVMELAHEILGPELRPSTPIVARNGAPVELHAFGDIGEAVAFLADSLRSLALREPTSSVALIARYSEQADAYYRGLERAEVPALRRVKNQEFSFAAGVDVTEVTQVKGLEFDYVVMLDVTAQSYADSIESRHMMHIAATRAAHQLWLVVPGEPSPLLPPDLISTAL
jgi:DNA helicase-2/ATP-dependent DNA helicase PcrA